MCNEIFCIECDGKGYTWYGNRTIYGMCEICGGCGFLNEDLSKTPNAKPTPLWPEHDEKKLKLHKTLMYGDWDYDGTR